MSSLQEKNRFFFDKPNEHKFVAIFPRIFVHTLFQSNFSVSWQFSYYTSDMPSNTSSHYNNAAMENHVNHAPATNNYAPSTTDNYAPSTTDNYAPSTTDNYASSKTDNYASNTVTSGVNSAIEDENLEAWRVYLQGKGLCARALYDYQVRTRTGFMV